MTRDRLLTLDATRGIAVMGILIVNIVAFAMPGDAYIHPLAWGTEGLLDWLSWGLTQLLFDGRMRGLFALLFGASAWLVMARAAEAGRDPVRVHLARMAALLVFGIAHFVFVWDGDILIHYALLGMIVWIARDWPVRRQVAVGIALIALTTLVWSLVFGGALAMERMAAAPGASAATIADWQRLAADLPQPGRPAIAEAVALFRGDYGGILAERLGARAWFPIKLLMFNAGETLGYMLIGMALMKSGFFSGGWSRALLRRRMLAWYALSLPVLALLTWWAVASGFSQAVLMGNFLAWSIPFRVLCALGHTALIVLLVQRFAGGRIVARIAAVGRMAFTNYLMTSIVMTTVFYGYGLGLYGSVGRAEAWLFVLAMWAAMLLWSKPWLDRFAYGPFEWAWRSLARLKVQPWRRNALATQSHLT